MLGASWNPGIGKTCLRGARRKLRIEHDESLRVSISLARTSDRRQNPAVGLLDIRDDDEVTTPFMGARVSNVSLQIATCRAEVNRVNCCPQVLDSQPVGELPG